MLALPCKRIALKKIPLPGVWPGVWAHLGYRTVVCTQPTSHELLLQWKTTGEKKNGVEIIGLCSVHYTERFLESRLICYCFAEHSIPVPPAMPFVWGTLGDLPALPALGSSALPPLQLIAVLLLLAASRSFPFGAACTRAEAAAQSLTAVSDDAIFLLSASEIRRRWTLADLGTCSTFTSFDSYCSFNALVFQGSGMCL